MKRKLFNAALFAAVLVAAPVSTFVSCADYDSDIENLQNQNNDLEALVLQKEEVLNGKIAALEAQNKELEAAYKAADEALKQALADNKTEILGEIATCKAECEAAIKNLQGQIDALKKSLGELQEKHDKDVKTLLEADKVLQQNIDAANNAIKDLESRLTKRIEALETLTATHTSEIAALQEALKEVKADIEKVRKEFADADKALEDKLQGKIDDLWKQVNANKTAIENEVTERKAAIDALTEVVNANKKACDDAVKELQAKDTELAGLIQTLTNDFNAYKDLNDKEVQALKDRMTAVEGQVSVNTKAILDLAARVADLYNGLDQLEAALEAAKAAQELVDAAQNARIDQLFAEKADKSELTAAVNTLTAKINEVAGDLANLTVRVNTNEGDIRTLKSQLSALRTEFDAAVKKFNDEIAALKVKDTQLNAKIDEVNRQLKADIKAVEEGYKAADKEIKGQIENLQKQLDALSALVEKYAKELSAEVKGFVLLPDNYYEGIQAIEGDVYAYNVWTVNGETVTKQKDYNYYCPEVVANYHVNPSTATLSEDTQYYAYTVEDRMNRGNNTELQPVIKKVAQDGKLLTVTMSLTNPAANKTPEVYESQEQTPVTVMALQYTNPAAAIDKGQVVTSDYAVLYLESLRDVSLLDEEGTNNIPDLCTHTDNEGKLLPAQVEYVNYKDSVDIEELITTQFGTKAPSTSLPEGFSYRYTYVSGDGTYFADIDNNGEFDGVVDPQLPNGKEATVACIGKHMVVRVDVMLGENVTEVGFFDFWIIGDAVVETAGAVTTDADYNISCDPSEYALKATLSTDSVWAKIVKVTGLSEAEAKADYKFVEIATSNELAQYSNTEGKYVSGKLGKVELNVDEQTKEQTLTWTVKYNELPSTLEFPLTTYVLVQSKKLFYSDTYNQFYLPLTWNPKKVEKWGTQENGYVEEVKWTYDKVLNQWQGDEIRLYADLTQTGSTPFKYNLAAKAIKNIKVELKNKFTNDVVGENSTGFLNNDGKFVFINHPKEEARTNVLGASGKKYDLQVSEDGSKLLAYTHEEVASRATSDVATGVAIAHISPEGVVELLNNDISKDLLNAYEKTQLAIGETLAAHVGYEVTACAGAVKVVTGDFDVRFIKPVSVNTETIIVHDAQLGTIKINLGQNIYCFNGTNFAEAKENYYTIFGLSVTTTEPATWKTNYNKAEEEEDVFDQTLEEVGIEDDFGFDMANRTVTYTNNTAVENKFTVKVPVTVKYIWGNPTTYEIPITIGRTSGNSNRK